MLVFLILFLGISFLGLILVVVAAQSKGRMIANTEKRRRNIVFLGIILFFLPYVFLAGALVDHFPMKWTGYSLFFTIFVGWFCVFLTSEKVIKLPSQQLNVTQLQSKANIFRLILYTGRVLIIVACVLLLVLTAWTYIYVYLSDWLDRLVNWSLFIFSLLAGWGYISYKRFFHQVVINKQNAQEVL